MKFLQATPFYKNYLDSFYEKNVHLKDASCVEVIEALIRGGFGAIHIIAPYMGNSGYDCGLVITNDIVSQSKWLSENNITFDMGRDWEKAVFRAQIEKLKPDILYLLDPVTHDSKFLRTLSWKPELIIGWKASNIPEGVDWSEFDLILSGISGVMEVAIKLGARAAEKYFPGFPLRIWEEVKDVNSVFDVSFTGSWTTKQHEKRNHYIAEIAKNSLKEGWKLGLYLNSGKEQLPPEVARYNLGARFGMDMYRATRSGKIAIDARGSICLKKGTGGSMVDLARNETMNMRIFEATGCGVFLLTEYFGNLKNYFEIGKEIEVFKDEKELVEKIRYYLAHPEQREAIAKRGQARCLRDYSMSDRIIEFDRIIRKHLELKRKTNLNIQITTTAQDVKPVVKYEKQRSQDNYDGELLQKTYPEVHFGKSVQLLGIKNTIIGAGSIVGDDAWINVAIRDDQVKIKIGKKVCIGRRSTISAGGYVEIGDYCLLAPNVYVAETDHKYADVTRSILDQGITAGRLIMEENCWCGINSVITGNITIGRGSVIGANSVVQKDVPAFSVVAGNPAKIIKMYNPQSNQWENIHTDNDIRRIEDVRAAWRIPERKLYAEIIDKNSQFKEVNHMAVGNGICI